jgi:O-antigen/teichoic acid export membrane protein
MQSSGESTIWSAQVPNDGYRAELRIPDSVVECALRSGRRSLGKPKRCHDGSTPMLPSEHPVAKPLSIIEKFRASQGVITFMGSRIVLIGCGFATYAIVARRLTTAEFGIYGVIGAILNILNTVLGAGTNQSISRLVAQNRQAASWLLMRGLRWSALVTVLTATSLLLGAPVVAAVLKDDSLTGLLMIVALVPGLYTISATYAGFLNGMQALSRQGLVNISLSVARLVLIGAAALLGYGLPGTLYGWVAAAAVASVAARRLAQVPAERSSIELRTVVFVRMMISFVGVSLLLQLLLANDLLLIKRLAPAISANQQAGIYTAAQSIARIPYYFLIGVSQIVYPRLSAGVSKDNMETARYTSSLVLTGMLVVLVGALALCVPLTKDMIRIIYPERYAEGATTLGWLLAGSATLSLAEASLTMLSGVGGPRYSVLVLGMAVTLQVMLGLLLIPRYGMTGAAQSTLVAALVAFIAAAALLQRLVGATLWRRLMTTSLIPVVALLVSSSLWARLGMTPIWTLIFMVVAYVGYLMAIYGLNASALRKLGAVREIHPRRKDLREA